MGTGDNGQHIADDLTQVAADIATVDGVHTNTELVTDLLDRADVHHAAVALRWLAVTEPKLCVDPTDITVAPLVDDADIVATLEGPSVATLDAAYSVSHTTTTSSTSSHAYRDRALNREATEIMSLIPAKHPLVLGEPGVNDRYAGPAFVPVHDWEVVTMTQPAGRSGPQAQARRSGR
ncbi:hypothetical protein ACFQ1S_07065 [Kibdelosporangium lantanae]|uniref:Uncharacterized protein n=1 Tax=Kibdelosporangium lantanae TaxID=1497396 RepID=A0ABW3M4B0_9PSEU